ncbi:MAG: hypothetical protein JOY99_07670 [Sphingomonadaceae bacterium]|nr:hypothetical protein [Sphingomonadaceae bacterium]
MSRLWDTAEFWARSEADEVLRDMPDAEPGALADSLERSAANYDGDPEMVTLIVTDLRRRAASGIRFWSGPLLIAQMSDASPGAADTAGALPDVSELIDDEIPW